MQENNIKFSIIVPVYNVEQYLPKCLDSLINQTYPNIEIICINDGSKDNSLQILEEYAKKDNRIKLINQQNQGVSVARNNGIDNATGDYILFVDSDDWLELDACEKFVSVLKKNSSDVVFYNYQNIRSNGTIYRETNLTIKKLLNNLLSFNSHIQECFEQLNIRAIGGKIFKKDFISRTGVKFHKDLWFGEDTLFIVSNLKYNPHIYIMDDFLYNYRISVENSLTTKNKYEQYKQLAMLIYQFCNPSNIKSENKLLEFCVISDTFKVLIYLFRFLYFTEHKKEYLSYIQSIKEKLENYNYQTFMFQNTVKSYEQNVFLAKIHLAWWYWKIIRPLGKYCIVLPFRRFREFLRSKNGK